MICVWNGAFCTWLHGNAQSALADGLLCVFLSVQLLSESAALTGTH